MNQQDILIISGMSGSGKSVALRVLEDAGYDCVDNLPSSLLPALIKQSCQASTVFKRLAIGIDVRHAQDLPQVPTMLQSLSDQGLCIRCLFLDASTEVLLHRFSETRRKHPLSHHGSEDQQRALIQAIELERTLLDPIREPSYVIDTSHLRVSQLQSHLKAWLGTDPAFSVQHLTLVFESFSFKKGAPLDADYVWDVRMLPNPHYETNLRELTGLDAPVAAFLRASPAVERMRQDIASFLAYWLPALAENHRSYVTVAIGCTGGQHRSVYLTNALANEFKTTWPTIERHREL